MSFAAVLVLFYEQTEKKGSRENYTVTSLIMSTFLTMLLQGPRGLRRELAAARLLVFWVRIPLGLWLSISCECCVLSGTGFWVRLITHPEEPYRVWYV